MRGDDQTQGAMFGYVSLEERDRLLEGDVAQAFFDAVLEQARQRRLLSFEHFTVDGTLIEAWASHKSFQPKGKKRRKSSDDDPGNPTVDFRGQRRKNETHASTTDPEALLARKKGQASKLSYLGNLLAENRHGLVVRAEMTQATGTAEWEAALGMLETIPGGGRITLGADKHYDTHDFVEGCRDLQVTPHVAQSQTNRASRRVERRRGGYEIWSLSGTSDDVQRVNSREDEGLSFILDLHWADPAGLRSRRRASWPYCSRP